MSQGARVRPTKKCLDQLGVPLPTVDVSLSDVAAEPLPTAQNFPERYEANGLTRVLSLKDRIWFKLKTSRWRGAVVRLTDDELRLEEESQGGDPCITHDHRWWVGAVGSREAGSRTDFYAEVAAMSACPVSPDKKDGIDTDALLPQEWDRKRLRAETAYAERVVYERIMVLAAARSLRSGKVIEASFERFSMGVVVRADRGQQFVAFIARNVFDPKRLAAMMDSLPGISKDDWGPEPGGIADLKPASGEIIWSAILPTEVADQILEQVPWSDD